MLAVMSRLRGIAVSSGRATAPLVHIVESIDPPPLRPLGISPDDACATIRAAAAAVKAELQELAAEATGQAQEILSMTALMAADPALLGGAETFVREQKLTPELAVWQSADDQSATLRAMGGMMAERAADVIDVRNRIVAHLTGVPLPGLPELTEPCILAARDLSPADTANLDPMIVRGIVTLEGGPTSHTAILARDLGIPAIVAIDAAIVEIPEGTHVAIDGTAGYLHTANFDPADFDHVPCVPLSFDGEGRLADGTRIELMANISEPAGALQAVASGAEGVGLLRTEFLFNDAIREPSVERQVAEYGKVFAEFPGRTVIVRTLDIGEDTPFLAPVGVPNPALALRGFRAAFQHRSVIENQLQAIAQAAAQHTADVWVVAPMISTPSETDEFMRLARTAGLRTAGVLIEVPAAALNAGPILARADFATLGTNDLIQYTFAADREIAHLAELATPWDRSILTLIQLTCQAAAQQDRPVVLPGEMAGIPELAVVAVGLGVTALSMSARRLGVVARVLESVTLAECRELAGLALGCESGERARELVRGRLPILEELGR